MSEVSTSDFSKRLDEVDKEREAAFKAKNEAVKQMRDAIEKIASDVEMKDFSADETGLTGDIVNMAKAFEIVAKRIKEMDDQLSKNPMRYKSVNPHKRKGFR